MTDTKNPKRKITVMMSSALITKIRQLQAKKINETDKHYSFSKAVQDLLEDAIC